MSVIDINEKIVKKQVDEIEKLADVLEVIIEHTEDDEVRASQEDRLHELRKQIDDKKHRLDSKEGKRSNG